MRMNVFETNHNEQQFQARQMFTIARKKAVSCVVAEMKIAAIVIFCFFLVWPLSTSLSLRVDHDLFVAFFFCLPGMIIRVTPYDREMGDVVKK